ncbi:MAG: flavodoxin domain-containing protein [Bacteroidota bacterium]|nr:flavodoxin domain-containing protein [Bacteroidota bacterium]
MEAIIIYKGKYGATKQYAEWLGADLHVPVRTAVEINGDNLARYDVLLIGTSVYIGKLQIEKWLRKNLSFIKGKKIFLFQVAADSPTEKEKRQAYNRSGIPGELINNCAFYFLPGKMILQQLSWKDRFMLKMGARLAKDPEAKKTMLTDYNDVRKDQLEEMLIAIKGYMASTVKPLAAIS